MNVRLFERPLPDGWVYPCTLDDIQQQLAELPASDLEGLWAVGLVPATWKDCHADARYRGGERPVIHLYSMPRSLSYKQPYGVRRGEIERGRAVELAFGMRVEAVGPRLVSQWETDDWRRYILQHVLIHEIGHHIYWRERERKGFKGLPSLAAREQFAEDYALRYMSRQRQVSRGPRSGG